MAETMTPPPTFSHTLDVTMAVYFGLGVLGGLVWLRDKLRMAVSRFRSESEADQ